MINLPDNFYGDEIKKPQSKKETTFQQVLKTIEAGQRGENTGLPMGFSRLMDIIPGIQKGTYYLVGAETGVGKTSFVDHSFLYSPYEFIKSSQNDTGLSLKVFYFSFEIDRKIKIAKAIARKMFIDYRWTYDINYILSRGKNRISDEVFKVVCDYADYFEAMEDCVTVLDFAENPTGVMKFMQDYFHSTGTRYTRSIEKPNGEVIEIFDTYIPNNPNEYVIVIVDHVSLLKKEKGLNNKGAIDLLSSEYLIRLRNEYNAIPVVVQQLNRDATSTDRFKLNRLEPQLSDFKDSGNTQQDANVIMSLFSPARYEVHEFPNRTGSKGYDITTLKDRFRYVNVLKNRDGSSDVGIGMWFVGEVGYLEELPKPTEIDYKKYVNLT